MVSNKRSIFSQIMSSSNLGILFILIALLVVMVILKPDFLGYNNFDNISETVSVSALVGLSQMVIIALGGLNLAVGALGGAIGVFAGLFMSRLGWPTGISVILAVLLGAVGGLISGLIISRVSSTGTFAIGPVCFLTTLAMSSVFNGFDGGVSQGLPFYNMAPKFNAFGVGHLFKIPWVLIVALILVFLIAFIYNYSSFGKQALAIGGNIKAAALSGINIRRVITISFVISGVLSATAALLTTARLKYAEPATGNDWLLFSFAIPLIGGTRLTGGKISVLGTFIGALIIAVIEASLVFLNVNMYWLTFIEGFIIIFVVGLDRIRTISNERREKRAFS